MTQQRRVQDSPNRRWPRERDDGVYALLTNWITEKKIQDTAKQSPPRWKGVTEEEFGRSTGLSTVERVRFRIPTREGITRATALISLASQEEAKKACEEGVLWQAQLSDCEPYWGALQATQCYKCWGWGHTQRFCKGKATCPRCAAGVHGGGGRGQGRPNALPWKIGSHLGVRPVEGGTRPGYGGARKQLKPGVRQGRHTFSGRGPLSWPFRTNNNDNSHYNRCGILPSRGSKTQWRKPTMASKKQEKGSGSGVDPPASL
ncbi:predicted protein [Chaetomium globosum CBS 148.51]|uniref:CCHC-type domain-containing protein n=1 Tax=Chaetomium globosum (strain ATCC 6205 / CBS 148.51 / DSM 1962 / NBRC 6347 / NRRL 1970) TaxID=306901 RepID=Q2HHK9_CHAGB|nr:uncharacterized protein CHGG_00295 [Chaetomium globosum CBS 148.51]EAQ92060.1 predicted protein [Chaetomium globosum CBS 148.51]